MWHKIQLYVISLWLLFALLFVSKVNIPICFRSGSEFVGFRWLLNHNLVAGTSLLFIAIGGLFYNRFNYRFGEGATNLPVTMECLKDQNFEILSFLATYIIPLVCFALEVDLTRDRNLLMLYLVLGVIGWIYIKTNVFYTNPTLAVLGFRVYKFRSNHGQEGIVIIKHPLILGDEVKLKKIDGNIYFGKKDKQ